MPEPCYFGEPACFGWLHRAAADTAAADNASAPAGLPVLICAPLGSEDLAAHQTVRLLAERLAARGIDCLRFDLPGHGDSAPLPDDNADRLPIWQAGIHQAIDALKAATGAATVRLVGLRLGASLAARVAGERRDVAQLVALAPVLSGRHLLREWKLLAQAGPLLPERADGGMEAGGFDYNGATCASLKALDLLRQAPHPAPQVVVLDRAEFPAAAGWVEVLRRAGGEASGEVRHEILPGYDGLLTVAHLSTVPEAMLAGALEALTAPVVPEPLLAPGGAAPAALPISPLRAALESPGRWAETPVRLHVATAVGALSLFGIATRPAVPAAGLVTAPAAASPAAALAGWGVLVLNTGAERRIGPHGLYPPLQREWAEGGATSLRIDLSGLGDSPPAPGEAAQQVYPATARDQIVAGLGWLRGQPGVQRVAVLGLCSGAYQAFRAAVDGVPLQAAIVINPLMYFFNPEVSLSVPMRSAAAAMTDDSTREAAVQQLSTRLWQTLREPAAWRKLAAGQVNVRFIGGLLMQRAGLAAQRLLQRGRRALGLPVANDVAAALDDAQRHGVALHFVFASGDPGEALLAAQAGGALARHLRVGQAVGQQASHRPGQFSVTVLHNADHTLTTRAAREQLRQAVLAALSGTGAAR